MPRVNQYQNKFVCNFSSWVIYKMLRLSSATCYAFKTRGSRVMHCVNGIKWC